MASNKKINDFSIARMPQVVYDAIGNQNADMVHVITKNDDDTNLEIYSKQRADQLLAEKVSGPSSVTANRVATFSDTTGKVIKDSGFTIGKSVPSNAKFTDTVYTHPTYTAKENGLYKVTVDSSGHVSAVTAVAKSDITALGIPAQDTTYSAATTSAAGLMSAADKTKLEGIATGANKTTVDSSLSSSSTNPVQNKVVNSALSAKAPLASPALTGTPTAPTASAGTNTTQIATTAFVKGAIDGVLGASNAMTFEGTIGTNGTVTALPASHDVGHTYVVATAGTYAGETCEVGDLVICTTSGTTANDDHWTVVQTNINGAVTGPATSVNNRVAVFNGTTGKVIKDSGYTIAKSVPSDAKFTDTVYTHPTHDEYASGLYKVTVDNLGHVTDATAVTKSDITALGIPGQDTVYTHPTHTAKSSGLYKVTVDASGHVSAATAVTKSDITALGIPGQDTVYTHPTYTTRTSGLYKITVDSSGHVSAVTAVAKADITALGIPAQDTTYSAATTSTAGLMSTSDKSKLDGITAGANKYTHPSYTAKSSGLYKITVDATGHVSAATAVAKADITALGIPAQDTTYSAATTSKAGLMSAADKSKLDGITAGASTTTIYTYTLADLPTT